MMKALYCCPACRLVYCFQIPVPSTSPCCHAHLESIDFVGSGYPYTEAGGEIEGIDVEVKIKD